MMLLGVAGSGGRWRHDSPPGSWRRATATGLPPRRCEGISRRWPANTAWGGFLLAFSSLRSEAVAINLARLTVAQRGIQANPGSPQSELYHRSYGKTDDPRAGSGIGGFLPPFWLFLPDTP